MKVVSVNVARSESRLIKGRRVQTAIGKRGRDGSVAVLPLGLEGDEQADPTVHGGLRKALYAYPTGHYAFWQTVRAQARVSLWDEALPWGALGENLSIEGLDETRLWVGDELELPGCRLTVTEPRHPCFKFNAAMGFDQASQLMVDSGYCGTYLAVRDAGTVSVGDTVRLTPGPRELALLDLFRAKYRGGRSKL
jgi:MOSC domain-containing protein YiiM